MISRPGIGEAGQTKGGVILCHQVRTISLGRTQAGAAGTQVQYLVDPDIRRRVRQALQQHFGLDVPARRDGAG